VVACIILEGLRNTSKHLSFHILPKGGFLPGYLPNAICTRYVVVSVRSYVRHG
jgi:hypothetical protein